MGIGLRGGGGGKLCPFQMSILINTFVACHNKFKIRIEKGPMTESRSVVFFSENDILNVLAFHLVNVYLT